MMITIIVLILILYLAIKMGKVFEFLKLQKNIRDYFEDHYKNFGCYPLEFEYNDKVYSFRECEEIIKTGNIL